MASAAELDAQILDAERAVMARDQRLKDQVHTLRASVRARAARTLAIAAGALLGGLLLGTLLWRSRSRTAGTVRQHVRRPLARGRLALARMPWLRLLPLAWPLLPLGLRSRLPPGTAALLMALGAPGLARATREHHDDRPAPATANDFDLQLYLGQWYEIARLPLRAESSCSSDAMAHYSLAGDTLLVDNRCRGADGRVESVQGRAVLPDPAHPERLRLTFAPAWLQWLPMVWADYWVLYVDSNYRMALVGTPDRRHLWLLSRESTLAAEDMQRLCNEARDRGYDPAALLRTPQVAPLSAATATLH